MKLEVVIPTRERVALVKETLRLFPDAILCTAKAEEAAYRKLYPKQRYLTHELKGLPIIRQKIMDEIEADAVFMVDDDIFGCYSMAPTPPHRLFNQSSIATIVENCATNARQAGTICFWFCPKPDPRLYWPFYPFQLSGTYKGWVQGFWRDEFNKHIRFDPRITIKANIDISLRIARRYKFLWCDMRYSFCPRDHMTQRGGLASYRTEAALKADYDYLRQKHGNIISLDHTGKLESRIRVKPRKK